MNLVDMKVTDFLDKLASNAAAPGGGSVSALAAANGAGLMVMAGELTFKKKKFNELNESKQKEFIETIEKFRVNKGKFIDYIDEDTKVFNSLMKAFKMPKESEEDRRIRRMEIKKATMETIRVPMEVCNLSIQSLRMVRGIMERANKNTISDQGVAVLMLHSAIEGSAMNVLINLSGLSDAQLVKEYQDVIADIKEEASDLREELLEIIKL
ncbi:MAG: cyclodeaminase/cyclohydrolase family protein [Candidatus Izimaplasma sp.]|nr:cyclodeaminase/cyclohydrolase family protein [Candidatus Izimaplasma bacterium]